MLVSGWGPQEKATASGARADVRGRTQPLPWPLPGKGRGRGRGTWKGGYQGNLEEACFPARAWGLQGWPALLTVLLGCPQCPQCCGIQGPRTSCNRPPPRKLCANRLLRSQVTVLTCQPVVFRVPAPWPQGEQPRLCKPSLGGPGAPPMERSPSVMRLTLGLFTCREFSRWDSPYRRRVSAACV